MRRNSFSSVLGLLLASPLATASTWVVDSHGGAGVDFTDIGAAEAASAPGDVILVMPGNYPGFRVDIPVAILGQAGGNVTTGAVRVENLPAGSHATLGGMTTGKITLASCSGSVTLEDLIASSTFLNTAYGSVIQVSSCTDVRLRNVTASPIGLGTNHALSVSAARVEVTQSVLKGGHGHSFDLYNFLPPPEPGGDGIRALSTSANVHLSASDVRGGGGGNLSDNIGCGSCVAGDGGSGIRLVLGHALVTGPASALVLGGPQGISIDCDTDGMPGRGITVAGSASLELSGAVVESAQSVFNCIPFLPPVAGNYTQVSPADPTLGMTGSAAAGQTITFHLTGEPGAHAILNIGRQLTLTDVPNATEDELTFPLRNISLGTLPASGEATYVFTLPLSAPKGTLLVFQGRTIATGGALALTQSLPITLR